MAQVLGLGVSHYPPLSGLDKDMANILRGRLADPDIPAAAKDPANWPAPFDEAFYIVMNVAVGGNFPGKPDESTRFPAELQVDWVRVYEKTGGYGEVRPRGRGRLPWHKRR